MSNSESGFAPVNQQASRRTVEYAVVDVFAANPLEGNALAIFLDGRDLSDTEMLALARETNLSETTFILPRDPAVERDRGVQVRIFTTEEELQFAGHPTLGTATWIYGNHPVLGGRDVTLELPVGPIAVRFDEPQGGEAGIFGTMRQRDPVFGQQHDRVAVARALGLGLDDLHPELAPQTVSTGLPFCIVPLRSLHVVARLKIPQAASQAYLAETDARFFYCIAPTATGSSADWHARMQFYNGEDPATGSAAGCAVAYLVRQGAVRSTAPAVIEQGIEMLRPSRIHVRATLDGEAVTDVFVGGRTIPVATGRFFLP